MAILTQNPMKHRALRAGVSNYWEFDGATFVNLTGEAPLTLQGTAATADADPQGRDWVGPVGELAPGAYLDAGDLNLGRDFFIMGRFGVKTDPTKSGQRSVFALTLGGYTVTSYVMGDNQTVAPLQFRVNAPSGADSAYGSYMQPGTLDTDADGLRTHQAFYLAVYMRDGVLQMAGVVPGSPVSTLSIPIPSGLDAVLHSLGGQGLRKNVNAGGSNADYSDMPLTVTQLLALPTGSGGEAQFLHWVDLLENGRYSSGLLLPVNNSEGIAEAALSAVDTVLAVVGGTAAFVAPGPHEASRVTLTAPYDPRLFEICALVGNDGASLELLRGQEGTAALDWPLGTQVRGLLTGGLLELAAPTEITPYGDIPSAVPVEAGTTYGTNATAPLGALALGKGATVSADSQASTVVGEGAMAISSFRSLSVGGGSYVIGCEDTTMLGVGATAVSAKRSVAVGTSAAAGSSEDSIAVGFNAAAGSSQRSIAIGSAAAVGSATDTVALGFEVAAGSAQRSIALGAAVAIGSAADSVVIGHGAAAGSAKYSLALGQGVVAGSAQRTVVLGAGALANSSYDSIAAGYGADVKYAWRTVAVGRTVSASGAYDSVILGDSATAGSATRSVAVGAGSAFGSTTDSVSLGAFNLGVGGARKVLLGAGLEVDGNDTIVIGSKRKLTNGYSQALAVGAPAALPGPSADAGIDAAVPAICRFVTLENYIFSATTDLAVGDIVLTMPSGMLLIPSEVGIMALSGTGDIDGALVTLTGDNVGAPLVTDAALTGTLASAKKFRLPGVADDQGHAQFTLTVTAPPTSGTGVFRLYVKGLLLQS